MSTQELDLNALGLTDEPEFANPVSLEDLPEQIHGYELPQPGRYVFQLPAITAGVWPNGLWEALDDGKRKYLRANFKQGRDEQKQPTTFDGRLTMGTGATARKLSLSLNNLPMGKLASKLDYLIAEGLGFAGSLTGNAAYVRILAGEGGHKFTARLVWTASNKASGVRYSSSPWKSKDGTKERVAIPRDPASGKFLQEFVDDTGQLVRCWPDLEDFGPAA